MGSLLVYGNCNADVLAGWMRDLSDEFSEVIWQPSFGGIPPQQEDVARARVVWWQIAADQPDQIDPPTSLRANVVTFPPCNSQAYWPFGCRDPHTSDAPGCFPFGDTLINHLAASDVPADEIPEAYHALSELQRHVVAEVDHHDRQLLHLRDAACDVQIADAIIGARSTKRTHLAYNHPARCILGEMLGRLCERSRIAQPNLEATGWPVTYEPLDRVEMPVARTVAEELGIEWDVEHRLRFHEQNRPWLWR